MTAQQYLKVIEFNIKCELSEMVISSLLSQLQQAIGYSPLDSQAELN